MRIRFYNARVLAMDADMEIRRGEVWVEENRIAYVGPGKASGPGSREGDRKWDREIDLEGNLLMPGFVNAHTHSAMTFLRSFADDLPLQEWLGQQAFRRSQKT